MLFLHNNRPNQTRLNCPELKDLMKQTSSINAIQSAVKLDLSIFDIEAIDPKSFYMFKLFVLSYPINQFNPISLPIIFKPVEISEMKPPKEKRILKNNRHIIHVGEFLDVDDITCVTNILEANPSSSYQQQWSPNVNSTLDNNKSSFSPGSEEILLSFIEEPNFSKTFFANNEYGMDVITSPANKSLHISPHKSPHNSSHNSSHNSP